MFTFPLLLTLTTDTTQTKAVAFTLQQLQAVQAACKSLQHHAISQGEVTLTQFDHMTVRKEGFNQMFLQLFIPDGDVTNTYVCPLAFLNNN